MRNFSAREINPYRQEIYRKLIHTLSALMGLSVLLFDSRIIVPVFIGLGIILPVIDLLRQRISFFQTVFGFLFKQVARPYEKTRITGASFVFISAAICVIFFDPIAAGTGLLFMSIGDSLAAMVGIRYGKTIIGHKSLEGSFACFLACAFIVLIVPGVNIYAGLFAAFIAAVIELLSIWKIDDNLLIPIVSALIIQNLGI